MRPIRHDVFISYSNAHDLPHAELLYSELQARGLNVFFDAACLRLDEPWQPQIAAALSCSLVVVLLISHAAVEAQTRAAALLPRPHDYLLLEHHLAAELHARSKRTVVPVYIGRLKSDGSSIHPASQPPQGCYLKCNASTLFPSNHGEKTDDAFNGRLQTPCALYIHGEVTSCMRSAAASVSSHVALAKGSFDWGSYLNKMREMFTSCASSIMRPFAFMSRPISWILARVQGAFDALGVFWQSTHTRFIGPAFRGVRSYAVDPALRFASHGLSFAAAQLPASVRAGLPDVRRHLTRWPAAWLLGLLALASPLLRYISAAVAKSLSSSMQE